MKNRFIPIIGSLLLIFLFYILSLVSYNLFHMTIEVSMLLLGILAFALSRLSQKLKDNNLMKIVGPGIVISSIILFLHALTYSGMNVISGYDSNIPTQLWIIANLILALAFIIGAFCMDKQINKKIAVSGLVAVGVIFVTLSFLRLFPDCYIVGSGLTLFKKLSELVIVLLYALSIYIIYRKRDLFEEKFFKHIIVVIVFLIIGELLFTFYMYVDDLTNFFGHIFKLFAFIEIGWIILTLNIGKPIENLFENLEQEVIRAQKSEAKTEIVTKTFKDLYENAPLGYQSLDADGKFLYVNDALTKMLGYSKEEMIGKWFGDFLDSRGSSTFKENFPKFKAAGEIQVNIEMLTKSGNVITIMFNGKIGYKDDGSFKQTHCILKDVTSEENAMKALIESKEKLRTTQTLLKASIDSQVYIPIFSIDTNYKYLLFNEAHSKGMMELYGVSIETGVCIFDYMTSEEDIKKVKANYDIALSGGNHKKTEQYGDINKHFYEAYYNPIINNLNEIIGISVFTEDVTDRIKREKEIEFLSFHDSLTGLYNRRFFEDQLSRLDNPRNLPLSVIMGDVNGLKLINDAFGHKAGDKLLKMIGDIIATSIRGNDISARWGGDEFAILLSTSGIDAAEKLIDRIQKQIKNISFEYGKISISFGVDTKKDKEEDINEIFNSAEKLMYQNKLKEIDSVRGETINTIMNTLFEKSIEVKDHSMRVSDLAYLIAEKMGLSKTNTNDIKTMGMIHDIGKIVIDLNILDKPGKLTEEEKNIIQQHPLSGSRMLNSSHEYARLATGVLHHHERIDGTGYPNGITGVQIPIESKIIAVADAFDAMTAERPYRLHPLSTKEAIAELQKHSGTQFDEKVVDVFINKVLRGNQ